MASFLFVCRKPPYGDSLAREVLDMVLAAAAFEQDVSLFFTDDGVWQLLKGQHGDAVRQKNHGSIVSALPLYEVSALYVDRESMKERGLTPDDLVLPVELLDPAGYAALARDFDTVMTF